MVTKGNSGEVRWEETNLEFAINIYILQVCVCYVTSIVSTLSDPMDCSPPGFCLWGFQARILEWFAMPSSGDLPDPGIKHTSLKPPALASGFFTISATWEAQKILCLDLDS